MMVKSTPLQITGPEGVVELMVDDANTYNESTVKPIGLAVIGHPHPLYGGTMHHKVVQTLSKSAVLCGFKSVRFNFRGVGESSGSYQGGDGELQDFLAVLAWLRKEHSDLPVVLGGFSFGAYIAARASLSLPSGCLLESMLLIGTPAGNFPVPEIVAENRIKTLVVHGEDDDVVELDRIMRWSLPQSIPITVVPGAGHFFHGQQVLLRDLCVRHLRSFGFSSANLQE